jgi:hypothetical protein
VTIEAGRTATFGSVTSNGDSAIIINGIMRHEGTVLQANVTVRARGEIEVANNDAQVTGRITVEAEGNVRVRGDNVRFEGEVAIDGTTRLEFGSIPPYYREVVRCNGDIEFHVTSIATLEEGTRGIILRYDAAASATATNLLHCRYRLTDGTTKIDLRVQARTPSRRLLSSCSESTVAVENGEVAYTYCSLTQSAASSVTASVLSVLLTIVGFLYLL